MKDESLTETRSSPPLIGVERTVRILQTLEESGSANLTQMAKLTGLSEPTLLRYLNSLVTLGLVEREAMQYRLGWEAFRLGQSALSGQVPRDAVRPVMDVLAREFNETINFAVDKHHSVIICDVVESRRAVKRISFVGQSDPWHASALGKAMMATMPDQEWMGLLEAAGMPVFTANTITTLDGMAAEIAEIRSRGFALDQEEAEEELTCVAAAVPAGRGQSAKYALSISFPTHRLTAENLEHAGNQLAAAAEEVHRRLS